MTYPATGYRGRFAPSPTGPLHFGSLVAALGSYLQARQAGGKWLVRIEDIDPPREAPGAADAILRLLEAFALHWDEDVVYQSHRLQRYTEVLEKLVDQGIAYRCTCTRTEIREHNRRFTGSATTVYPGLCRGGPLRTDRRAAIRLRVDNQTIEFSDLEAGAIRSILANDCGDFILKRRDGLFAYQLAVVVDDAAQEITEIVRGQDLLDSTPGQILLQRLLGFPTPDYMHLPVVTNSTGDKLSKQTGAEALRPEDAGPALCDALAFLGLTPPAALRTAAAAEIVAWGLAHWHLRTGPQSAQPTAARTKDFSPPK